MPHTHEHYQTVFTLRHGGFAGVCVFAQSGRATENQTHKHSSNEWSMTHKLLDFDDKRILNALGFFCRNVSLVAQG